VVSVRLPKAGRPAGATAQLVEGAGVRGRPRARARGGRWRCHRCGQVFGAYATAERHVDEEHAPGGRLECVLEDLA
jgi:hypothetical protein